MLISQHLGMGAGQFLPRKNLGHAGVQPLLAHQLVGGGRLLEVGKVAALKALLMHPHVAHVEGAVEARGAGADHHHAALFADQRGHGEGRLAGVLEDHVDIVALARDVPDRLAELAGFLEPIGIFRRVDLGQLPPAVEFLAVDHTLGAKPHDEFTLVLVRDHTDRIGTGRVDQLDRIGAEAAGGTPDQHVLTGLEVMGFMAEQHPVSGRKRQRITGALFPGEVFGARHQLLRLHIGELRKRAVRRLVAPDPLRGGEHRVAAVAFLIIAVVLVAVDHHLVANLPALDLIAHGPDDPRGVGARDVVGRAMAVEGADRLSEPGPDTVVIHARRHHQHQHLVTIEHRRIHDLDLEGLIRLAMALAADGPGVHLGRHIAHRGHLAHLVEVFHRRIVGGGGGGRV
mmetsp:Transcript_1160/g.2318  ORF Transcript_1160/g.2318 Transcript_1160/m.2318 type:complete len:399 (-) Transcript_1160:15-1211(-)